MLESSDKSLPNFEGCGNWYSSSIWHDHRTRTSDSSDISQDSEWGFLMGVDMQSARTSVNSAFCENCSKFCLLH